MSRESTRKRKKEHKESPVEKEDIQAVKGKAAEESVTIPKEAYEKLREKARAGEEHYDRLLRTQADLENFKKRSLKERGELIKFANYDIIADILPVLDNLDRALTSAQDNDNAQVIGEGVTMIRSQLEAVLKKQGVTPIEAVGKKFDPEVHEAISHVASEDYPEDTVIEEMQKGYVLHERLLRPAVVSVSKGKEAKEET